jgi:hypothetical protein
MNKDMESANILARYAKLLTSEEDQTRLFEVRIVRRIAKTRQ